jgi:hypothetical protein
MTDLELAALLITVADSLAKRDAGASAGIIRVGARRIAELSRVLGSERKTSDGCEWCGVAIVQPVTGRPRRFCSARCRKAAGRNGRNVRLAS